MIMQKKKKCLLDLLLLYFYYDFWLIFPDLNFFLSACAGSALTPQSHLYSNLVKFIMAYQHFGVLVFPWSALVLYLITQTPAYPELFLKGIHAE